MIEVILRAGAIQTGVFFSVNKKHIVSFTPPASLVVFYSEIAANIMPFPFYVQHNIVIFAFQVADIIYLRWIYLDIITPAFTGVFTIQQAWK